MTILSTTRVTVGRRRRGRAGLTLIEVTVVILVLLTLLAVLLIGARGWQRGTERARCVLNLRQMQMSVRAFSIANDYQPGTDLGTLSPPVNLLGKLLGPGNFVPVLPRCPGTGMYFFGGDVVPEIGQLYMSCSLSTDEEHRPKDLSNW